MRPLIDINHSFLRRVVGLMREEGVALLRWSFLWYDDQGDPYEVKAWDKQGREVEMWRDVSQDLSILAGDYGDFQINAISGQMEELSWAADDRIPPDYGGDPRDDSDVWAVLDDVDLWLQCELGDPGECEVEGFEMHTCTACGRSVCDKHYVEQIMLCTECGEGDDDA